MCDKKIFRVFILFFCISFASSEFVTAGIVAVGSAISAGFFAGFNVINCLINECCNDRWISANYTDLALTLNAKLYGQHLVIEPVVKHLKAHGKDNPSKALSLSFHGWTGTGKNYVSRIVAEKLFRKGMKSKYVHLISATKEFPHEEMVAFYKDKLREMVESRVKECARSFFIFDEMDKMPPGVIDTLKPYLDFYDNLGGVDYRKATFFFLSNTAGNDIAERTITHWKNNVERESIKLKEMEEVIRLPALNTKRSKDEGHSYLQSETSSLSITGVPFNAELFKLKRVIFEEDPNCFKITGGMWHSELILKNLITAFVPFLPLERRHVKQCIKDSLIEKKYYESEAEISDAKVQEIADEITYYPEGIFIFSTTGCKRINEKIDFIMEDL